MKNPIDVYNDTMSLMDIQTRGYATRNLVSSMNAQMVGFACRIIAQERRDSRVDQAGNAETGEQTIDNFNALLAAEALREAGETEPMLVAPVGMLAPANPHDAIKMLAFFRDGLQESMSIGNTLWDTEINTLGSTIAFMCTPRNVHEDDVKANAEILELPVDVVRAKMIQLAARRAAQMTDDRGRVLEIIRDEMTGLGLYDWTDMPIALQVRLTSTIDKVLARQVDYTIERVLSGRRDARANLKLLQGAQDDISKWLRNEEIANPDFQSALMNAA